MPAALNLTGQRFTRLTVFEKVSKTSGGQWKYKCVCDCGKETVVATGFKIRTASSPYNDATTNNWTATYDAPQKPFVGSNHVQGKAQAN